MKKLAKAIARVLFFNLLFAIRTSFTVWFWILNAEPRRKFERTAVPPGNATRTIITGLQKDGIAVTSMKELSSGKKLLEDLDRYAKELLPKANIRQGKPFLKTLWEEDMILEMSNPFMRLAISEEVLSVVNGYMGMFAKFFFSALDLTLKVPETAPRVRSQNWHRDPEDKKMVKMFVYLSDVDTGAGPFTYIKGSHMGGRWAHIFPQKPPKGSYPPEEEVTNIIPKSDITVATGKAGTVVFADTAGLHRGGYAHHSERLMFTAEYSSKASLRPIKYRYPHTFAQDIQRLSPQAQYAVSNKFGWITPLNKISFLAIRYGIYENPAPYGESY